MVPSEDAREENDVLKVLRDETREVSVLESVGSGTLSNKLPSSSACLFSSVAVVTASTFRFNVLVVVVATAVLAMIVVVGTLFVVEVVDEALVVVVDDDLVDMEACVVVADLDDMDCKMEVI